MKNSHNLITLRQIAQTKMGKRDFNLHFKKKKKDIYIELSDNYSNDA